jgi:hypothetical protein
MTPLCRWARLALVLSGLPVVGCECGDDPQLGRLEPELVIATDPLAFGEVPVGAIKRLTVELGNRGNRELNLQAVDAPMPFGAALSELVVRPGGRAELEVWFRPTNDAPQSGALTLSSDDPELGTLTIALSGQGVQGVLTVVPAAVDLEGTKVGATRSVELVLRNLGLAPVEGQVAAEGFAQPEHFTLTLLSSFAERGPFAVPARADQVLDLTYRPLTPGRHDGRILFEVCGPRCGLEVEVRASAADALVRLAPALLDFGGVGIGETRTQQLRLENAGDGPVTVEAVSVSGGAELSATVARALPATVEAGDALGINVSYAPTSAAELMGEVAVRTGPVVETVRAAVIGRGQGPRFRVDPERLFFGVEQQAGEYRRAVLMVNEGSSDVRVTGLSVSGDPEFALAPGVGLPARLGSGESLVAQVLFRPQALGEYTGALRVESNDAALPVVEVPLSGGMAEAYCQLEVSPERVSFGLLPPNFERRQVVTVRNAGAEACEVLQGAFRSPADPAITEERAPWPTTLGPGQSATLSFRYAPTLEAPSKANYVLRTGDPVFPERTVAIFGTSEGNLDIFTRPAAVDFGAMGLGCAPAVWPVTVVNAGTYDVNIDHFALTSSSSEFSLQSPLATPTMLPAGSTRTFGVSYQARDYAPDVGFVEIGVSEFGFSLNVPLMGLGSDTPSATDRFEQARNTKVDVLFVIDDSCSMADDQTALANNFRAFIGQADVRQVDFQIGITTTTLFPVPGALVGPVLTRRTPGLDRAFQAQAAVGVNGSGFEQGLEAMRSVFLAAAAGSALHLELLRPDAARVVVVVSDEDDQSPAPVTAYLNELRRSAPEGYTTAMVSGQTLGCASPTTGSASPAPRYEQFAALTDGLSESICSGWATTLANIGQAAFGLKTRFPLSREADTSAPIVVTVDGVRQASGWQYDAASAAIDFSAPPAEGAEIVVTYTPRC